MDKVAFEIADGFAAAQREAAVVLYWEAFRGKIGPVMRPRAKALAFLSRVADPGHVISAVAPDGTVIGIAGYKTVSGSFIGGDLGDMRAVYGAFGGLWRGLVLSVLERPMRDGVLLMDGIAVDAAVRGSGVGTALLTAIKAKARALGCVQVRLDVIEINPRARALYERQGFEAGETEDIGPLRHVFGFRTATKMVHRL